MDKKQKENIKRTVGEGLRLILSKLKISKPSAKMERLLKKHSRKLVDHFKDEVKRMGKNKVEAISKGSKTKATRLKKKRAVSK